jgi:hypothetical protein
MTFLAPWFLLAGGVAAVGVVLVHLLALQRPPAAVLPTARFVPDVPARAASRAPRPTDRLLLLLRLLAVLCAALAFARPVRVPERAPLRQVVVLDRSRAVGSAEALRERALALYRPGDAVIVADSSARLVGGAVADTLRALAPVDAPGNLAAALVAAQRAATMLRDSTDSVRIVLASPLAAESVDAATPAVRALWPGGIAVARLDARADSSPPVALDVRAPADDPLAVAAAFLGDRPASRPTRLLRIPATPADSAWTREGGGLLLVWPDTAPAGWPAAAADTVGAVATAAATLVAPFVRVARAPDGATARAWWVDGEPAAVETPLGAGCVRTVGVPVAGSGDLPLRPAFHDLLRTLLAPCGGARALAPLPDSALDWLRGSGAAAVALPRDRAQHSPLVPWLLGLAIALLLAELFARRLRGADREVAA